METWKNDLFLQSQIRELTSWPVRLGVRTSGFHPGNSGSIPLRATNKFNNLGKEKMAHHKSAKKRIKQDEVKTLQNKYYAKTMRNAEKKLRIETDKTVVAEALPKVVSMIDKLAKKNVIHKNKAANLKSSLVLHLNKI